MLKQVEACYANKLYDKSLKVTQYWFFIHFWEYKLCKSYGKRDNL